MSDSLLEKMSDGERSMHKRNRLRSPVFSGYYTADSSSFPDFRRICDLCMEPEEPSEEMSYGRAVTFVNADKQVDLRDLAELALKLYNDKKLESFKLVKVCKANFVGDGYYGLTFRAQEDGSEECPVFRGVVHVVGGEKAQFCEIKEDDEVTLRPDDDDYISSERACEKDCPPFLRDGERNIHKRNRSKSPVIWVYHSVDEGSLSYFRQICDLCMEPEEPGEEMSCGRAVTFVNADKQVDLRDMAELVLKLYNDKKLESFKLVKVCKTNVVGARYYGLTFRAQEDGSEECPVFRGIVYVVGGEKALFCEIKEDDEVTLLPDDDDYVSSERACESEDRPPSPTV